MVRTCDNCGETFTRRGNGAGRFCSHACYWDAMRCVAKKATVKGHRMRKAREHPLAPPSGTVVVARVVLYEKIGPGEHPCHWCDTTVKWIVGGGPAAPGSLIADHLDWDQGNDDPANLVPSCNTCNAHRTRAGNRRRIREGEPTVLVNGNPARAVERSCESCSEPFLTIRAEVKAGKGRFCSRSCARRAPRAKAA